LRLNKKKLLLQFLLEKKIYILRLLLHHPFHNHQLHLQLLLNNLMILNIELEPTFRSSRH
jgi:hypothetical protein